MLNGEIKKKANRKKYRENNVIDWHPQEKNVMEKLIKKISE